MKKRSIAFVTVALMLAVLAIVVFAGTVPTVTVKPSVTSLTQGRSFTVSFTADNFDTVGSADFNLHYDPAVFSVGTVTNGGMISGDAFISVNTDEAGIIKMSAVDMDGFSASGTLVTVGMKTLADAEVGKHSLKLTVGDTYGVDLNGIVVQGVGADINVTAAAASQKTFSLASYLSGSPASCGGTVSVRLANSNRYAFGSGDFVIEYDSDVFSVESVELESGLTVEGATYSVNSDVKGTVFVSYANSQPVNDFYLLKVNFKMIADRAGSTSVKSTARNVYADDLTPYLTYTSTANVTLKKLPEIENKPDIWLDTDVLTVGNKAVSILRLEAGAGVAAGDFKLTYDTEVLRCTGVSVCGGLSEIGGTIIIDDSYGDGTIEFPYVNESGYSDSDVDLVRIEWEVLKSPDTHYTVTIEGSLVSDVKYGAVELEYVTETGCIYVPATVLPSAEAEGYISYTCACGEGFTKEYNELSDVGFVYVEGAGCVALIPAPAADCYITSADVLKVTAALPAAVALTDGNVGTGTLFTVDGKSVTAAVLGDVDGDGRVNVFDGAIIKEALSEGSFANEPVREIAADFDRSGVTSADDAKLILSYVVGNTAVVQ